MKKVVITICSHFQIFISPAEIPDSTDGAKSIGVNIALVLFLYFLILIKPFII